MKATTLLLTAATFIGVQAACSSATASVCRCANEDDASNRNVCSFSFAQTPFVDTDGITKCRATGGASFTQCNYAKACGSGEAICS
ncbi:hypothetical protein LX32DRAFT_644921 [Colletotrichum zoysiae]|uniref:Uncharacterized protein n=1 Tax=Colletotrichum zoysiae TaxID=1216348 RepID=A0AAD9H6I1_9PEZI|nr:hypothetical protein LX32DRAFT_644921 [Colletotrichum zoysiae]